nr:trefoil factor 1 [Marmota flaviventris]
MGHKVTCILLMVLMLALSTLTENPGGKPSCFLVVYERMNCGFPGVTADDCKKRDCCFADSPLGYPWCFHPRSANKTGSENDTEGTPSGLRWRVQSSENNPVGPRGLPSIEGRALPSWDPGMGGAGSACKGWTQVQHGESG